MMYRSCRLQFNQPNNLTLSLKITEEVPEDTGKMHEELPQPQTSVQSVEKSELELQVTEKVLEDTGSIYDDVPQLQTSVQSAEQFDLELQVTEEVPEDNGEIHEDVPQPQTSVQSTEQSDLELQLTEEVSEDNGEIHEYVPQTSVLSAEQSRKRILTSMELKNNLKTMQAIVAVITLLLMIKIIPLMSIFPR